MEMDRRKKFRPLSMYERRTLFELDVKKCRSDASDKLIQFEHIITPCIITSLEYQKFMTNVVGVLTPIQPLSPRIPLFSPIF